MMCQNIWITMKLQNIWSSMCLQITYLLATFIFGFLSVVVFIALLWLFFLVETRHVDAKHAVSRSILGGFLGQWSFGFVTNDDFRDRNCFASQIAMNLNSKIKI